jgi:hypothetical protein
MRAESAPKLSDGAVCSRFLADARCSRLQAFAEAQPPALRRSGSRPKRAYAEGRSKRLLLREAGALVARTASNSARLTHASTNE